MSNHSTSSPISSLFYSSCSEEPFLPTSGAAQSIARQVAVANHIGIPARKLPYHPNLSIPFDHLISSAPSTMADPKKMESQRAQISRKVQAQIPGVDLQPEGNVLPPMTRSGRENIDLLYAMDRGEDFFQTKSDGATNAAGPSQRQEMGSNITEIPVLKMKKKSKAPSAPLVSEVSGHPDMISSSGFDSTAPTSTPPSFNLPTKAHLNEPSKINQPLQFPTTPKMKKKGSKSNRPSGPPVNKWADSANRQERTQGPKTTPQVTLTQSISRSKGKHTSQDPQLDQISEKSETVLQTTMTIGSKVLDGAPSVSLPKNAVRVLEPFPTSSFDFTDEKWSFPKSEPLKLLNSKFQDKSSPPVKSPTIISDPESPIEFKSCSGDEDDDGDLQDDPDVQAMLEKFKNFEAGELGGHTTQEGPSSGADQSSSSTKVSHSTDKSKSSQNFANYQLPPKSRKTVLSSDGGAEAAEYITDFIHHSPMSCWAPIRSLQARLGAVGTASFLGGISKWLPDVASGPPDRALAEHCLVSLLTGVNLGMDLGASASINKTSDALKGMIQNLSGTVEALNKMTSVKFQESNDVQKEINALMKEKAKLTEQSTNLRQQIHDMEKSLLLMSRSKGKDPGKRDEAGPSKRSHGEEGPTFKVRITDKISFTVDQTTLPSSFIPGKYLSKPELAWVWDAVLTFFKTRDENVISGLLMRGPLLEEEQFRAAICANNPDQIRRVLKTACKS